ncbi:OmpA/MotB family protein [Croceimicrobium hydrocarbonivorans]|uniref:OmpA family protein n=1 Tax=Croceimicrobium hydrocarbonivorans TaxID=2761580 RepID=A0A7H0VBL3_9FLAO|nr:OmpA family protein [Croceimicrobium hydrocarbonivorans]QNR23111.1 OmpA family protein [Croceimicrobium hydrocarbonivorans]
MKKGILILGSALVLSSCVSKSKYTALQDQYNETSDELSKTRMELAACLDNKKNASKEIDYLKKTNYQLLKNIGNMSTLSKKEAENLERSLEQIKEKDLTIQSLQDAINKRDSVTFALVTSLKGATVGIDDEDISINVEKGVVYVSISDKLLFTSGSSKLSKEALAVLGKVAQVLKSQPELEFMVEGHTDNKAVRQGASFEDNWELSAERAASVVRVLEKDFNIKPERMTVAGKGEYAPVASNDSAEGRAQNRRTRIVILPKLDEFYSLIEEGMEKAK